MTVIDALKIFGIWGTFTEEELKKKHRELQKKWHPDIKGDVGLEMSKLINAAYDAIREDGGLMGLFDTKGWTKSEAGLNPFDETLAESIALALSLAGVNAEVCGVWLWLGGETRPHRNTLKSAGFKWAPLKKKWYWRHGKNAFRANKDHKETSMDSIRAKYGSKMAGSYSPLLS